MSNKKIRMFLTACFVMAAIICLRSRTTNAVVIALDPGHDNVHTGAQGNGLREEYLNLQIALACRNELETYEGVSVYMIRSDEACSNGGNKISSTTCNARRVDYAASVGANAYISLHNNSSTNTSARGVSVYYPTTNYNRTCGEVGQGLAQSIISNLKLTGLQDRGISTRVSGDNTRYPDGSLADYYGVIRRSKLAGIPAIIIEHAFVSNPYDATEFLGTYGKLWSLGVLDARGIAQYYGLQKKQTLEYTNASVTGNYINGNQEYSVLASGIKGASSVSFAVWSDQGGQDDLYWYNGTQDANGNWTTIVKMWANHKTEGTYYVHVYANGQVLVKTYSFTLRGPSASDISFQNVDGNYGTFDVKISGVLSGADIDAVSIAVWNNAARSNIRWSACRKTGSGVYEASVDIKNFQNAYGAYTVQVYVADKNHIVKCIDTRQVTIEKPQVILTCQSYDDGAIALVKAYNLLFEQRIAQVYFDIYPTGDKQRAVRYHANCGITDSWMAYVYTADLDEAGAYTVCAYEELEDGTQVLLGEQSLQIPKQEKTIAGVQTEQGYVVFEDAQIHVTAGADCSWNSIRMDSRKNRENIRSLVGADKEFVVYELDGVVASDTSGVAVQETVVFEEAENELQALTQQAVAVDVVTAEAVTERAVTASAVTGDAAAGVELLQDEVTLDAVTFQIPTTMLGRAVEVYVLSADGTALERVNEVLSEEKTSVTVYGKIDRTYVLVAAGEEVAGDVDDNQAVDLKDASRTLKMALGIEPVSAVLKSLADVDKDDAVTLQDAFYILKAALRIVS